MFFILRNTDLTPREVVEGVRSIGKLYVPPENSTYTPCKIEPFAFPIIPAIQSPQFRSLDRTRIGRIPRYLWFWRTPKVPHEWFTCIQLRISSLRPRPHESGYFWNRIRSYTNRPSIHSKGIRATSNFIALIPTRSIRQLLNNFSGLKF